MLPRNKRFIVSRGISIFFWHGTPSLVISLHGAPRNK